VTEDLQPAEDVVVDIAPLGLICGGTGTPLGETWVDLTSPNHVFYGLNGAGKTSVLDSLRDALMGRMGGGQILTRIPFTDERLGNAISEAISMMLIGDDLADADEAHRDFLDAQRDNLWSEFTRRHTRRDWSVDGSRFDALDWNPLLEELAASQTWLFTPVGVESGRWSTSPVILCEPDGAWSEHLEALMLLNADDGGPILRDLGVDLLWWEVPIGAPVGIVGTMVERFTAHKEWQPWWPFGQVIADEGTDERGLTRQHLLIHPADRWGSRPDAVQRDTHLTSRVADIQQRANVLLSDMLADAPALYLDLGEDGDWFAGRSCTWTATRFEGDPPMPLDRLSSAERRWTSIAVSLALAGALNALHGIEGSATTWLLLDEPERGLHRTAEAQMATGIAGAAGRGLRSVLATHSPELLDTGMAEVNFVRRRSHNRPGTVVPMSAFDGVREELGLNPSDMLRRIRGIALVEGEHDVEVLTGTIGSELERLGVTLIPTRGAARLKTVVDSRFLFEFTDAVLFPILDDLSGPIAELWDRMVAARRTAPASEVITQLRDSLKNLPGKGHEFLEQFLSASLKSGTYERIQPLGIPQTDVLMCLPVSAFIPSAKSWRQVRDDATRSRGGDEPSETAFKEFLKKNHGVDLSEENIRRVASAHPAHPDIKALLAAIDQRLSQ
jgi:hypothetical protein